MYSNENNRIHIFTWIQSCFNGLRQRFHVNIGRVIGHVEKNRHHGQTGGVRARIFIRVRYFSMHNV